MKFKIFVSGCLTFLLLGCKENEDIVLFDDRQTYLFFNDSNMIGGTLNYVTEKTYSFAYFDKDVTTLRVGIPIALIGKPLAEDKSFSIEIDKNESNLPEDGYQFEPLIFHKGHAKDSLFITFKKLPEMTQKTFSIKFLLKENENFKLGIANSLSMKLNISNILIKPAWWDLYTSYLGPFYTEVFQQWILTYTKDSDPTPDAETQRRFFFYWGNMPDYFQDLSSDYPVLFYYIQVLKKYFQDNVVYPNGDSSQNRILLP